MDRDYRTPQGYYFCHRGSHRDWGQLYHRRVCHHREQVWLYAHDHVNAEALPLIIGRSLFACRRKEVMRIGDDNLFEIGCRACVLPTDCMSHLISVHLSVYVGVESPSVGNFNTVSTRARVHHTVRISSYCVIGAGCLVVPTDDEVLDEYTVVYGPSAERRVWSGRGRVQEADLRRKHAEYLRETLPKFNRLRKGDGHG